MRRLLCALALLLPSASFAQGFAECDFGFDIDTQSSAFQAMIIDGEQKRGFWLSINRAPSDVRTLARSIGRLQVCLTTPDGKPRTITRGGSTITLDSPFVTNCTAALLPGNRLLTNGHCYYDPALSDAGFTIVREARVNFLYTTKDDTGGVRTYLVAPQEVALADDVDAMLLQIIGGDPVGDLGGHIPMKMMTELEPFQELRLIHHPAAEPQQYSAGTCQVHRRQEEIPGDRSPFRHTCESTGGSSGSLLFDARTLAIVALHNQGGLSPSGDSYNGGHKIAMVNEALGLGFEPVSLIPTAPPPDPNAGSQSALVAALLMIDNADKKRALEQVIADFPGSPAASQAERALQSLANVSPPAPTPVKPPVTPPVQPPVTPPVQPPVTPPITRPGSAGPTNPTATGPTNPPVTPPVAPPVAPPVQLTLVERMLADPDVQNCDTLAGGRLHPDRATGAMIAPGLPYAEMNGPAGVAACRAALAKFPDHPRLLSFLGDALMKSDQRSEALSAYERSAALGDVTAITSLGFLYSDGRGVTQDANRALALFERATAQNFPTAYTGIGILYRGGKGFTRDYGRALSNFERAASLGEVIAMSMLAEFYEFGLGIGTDPNRAAALYVQALEGGVVWFIEAKRRWDPATGRALQVKLRDLGYYQGGIDGAIGPGTRAAMERLRVDSL